MSNMICPHCRTENREGRRFCANCGGSLLAACGTCGFRNEPQDLFCGGCGVAVSPGIRPEGSPLPGTSEQISKTTPSAAQASADRRPVSVMFVDLSGYTAMSAKLDPEDTHRLLHRFFEVVDGIVVGFGGTIDKHIGDSVMALFGAPVAHGNDPERAIRAALDIHVAMPVLVAEFGRDMNVHIGLALGEVIASGLGSSAHSAYTVTGDAANLASRLMGRATSGETLVAETLRRATQNIAAFEAVGLTELKGLSEPQAVYRLVGLRSDQTPEPAMVGRRGELAQLLAVLKASQASGRGAAISIRGDPGIGKSRLLREIKKQAVELGFICVSGLVLDFGAHTGEDAMAAITAGLLSACIEDANEKKAQAIDAASAVGRIDQADRPFVHDLLGLPQPPETQAVYAAMDARARRRGMSSTLSKLLLSAAAEQAFLIAVEDLHWANEATLYLLAQLAAVSATCPAVVVMTTRFDGDPFNADWRAQSSGGVGVTIDLRPLQTEDATVLASGVISEADDFTRQCVARAEGNPLFLEQLLRSRLGDSSETLPHSVQGVVLARLDSLAETDRRALQAACVLGQRFLEDDLRALLGSADYDCRPMIQRQLLRPEGDGYLFAHALIRDGVYASLTRERRRDLHLKAAHHFADRDPVLRAEHLDRAEDVGAAKAYLHAAEAEAMAYRTDQAIVMAARGLEIATSKDDVVKLGLVAGRLRLDTGQAKLAHSAYGAAVEAAQDKLSRCLGLIGLAAADRMLASVDQAMDNLGAAEAIAVAIDSPTLLSEIHYMRGNLHFARGYGDACHHEHSLALAAAERAGQAEWKARALSGLGDSAYLRGRIRTALQHFQACVDTAQKHNLLRVIPANQCMIGDCMAFLFEFEGALSQIDASYATALRIGDRFCEMFALQSKAYVLLAAGHIRESEDPAESALKLAVKLGARRYVAFLQNTLALVRFSQGRIDDARALANAALSLAEETGIGFCGPMICGTQAQLHGPGEEGRAWIARGESMLVQTGLFHNHAMFRIAAIDWAITADDWLMVERFARELSSFTEVEPLPYIDLFVNRARALSALKHNPDDKQAVEALKRLLEIAKTVDLRL